MKWLNIYLVLLIALTVLLSLSRFKGIKIAKLITAKKIENSNIVFLYSVRLLISRYLFMFFIKVFINTSLIILRNIFYNVTGVLQ
jgi:hypothetical protein